MADGQKTSKSEKKDEKIITPRYKAKAAMHASA